jgi:hypothetical protein
VTLPAVVPLEDDYPIAHLEVGPWKDIDYGANTFVAQVRRIVVKLEIVRRPYAGSLQADGRDLVFNNRVPGFNFGVRALDQSKFPGFRNG